MDATRKILLAIAGLIALVLILTIATQQQTSPPPGVSADSLLNDLRRSEAGGDALTIVNKAQALTQRFPGTPEADSAKILADAYAEEADSIRAQIAEREAAEQARRAREAEAARLAAKWSYNVFTDEMTSKASRDARIRSENTVEFDFPYEGPQHATLVIRNHPSYGRDVYLRIREGQILCRSYEDCDIRVRFDEENPRSWRAVGPSDNSSEMIFLRNQEAFRRRMRAAEIVRIQIPVYDEGNPTFEFHVGGFNESRLEGS